MVTSAKTSEPGKRGRQVSKFVAGRQFDKILTKERVGKILEGGLVCKILEQRGPEQGGACLVPFNIIKGFIGRISFPRLHLFSHSFRRAYNAFFPGRIDFPNFSPTFPPAQQFFPAPFQSAHHNIPGGIHTSHSLQRACVCVCEHVSSVRVFPF